MESLMTDRFAEALGRARLNARRIPDFSANDRPKSEDEGYALQLALADWFSAQGLGPVSGYKIGATTPAMRDYLGVQGPAYGHIMAANVFPSQARIPATRFCKPGIECEVAVRVGRDIPTRTEKWSLSDITPFVEGIAPAIEVVENRYTDFLSAGFATLIADDFFHKGCVLGPFMRNWAMIDLAGVTGRIIVNGEERATGDGAQVMGHPLEPVAWLANKLQSHGRSLKAGDLVLTGSMTPVIWISDYPSDITIDISGLGECSIALS